MTINKSQGQTLELVELFLPTPVISHGQLYVAVSRSESDMQVVFILSRDTTCNIVYHEIIPPA
ncbi:hypothetical protein LINPERPRIM_LOCUS32454 [Linum perenne]